MTFACSGKSDEPKKDTVSTNVSKNVQEKGGASLSKDLVLGHWTCVDLRLGNGMSMQSMAASQKTYTFNSDNTVIMEVPGTSIKDTAQYKIENNELKLFKGDTNLETLIMKGTNLVMEDKSSDMSLIYKK